MSKTKKQKDYYDRILLKLKRQYGKDELVSALVEKLKKAETECGILKSERDEAIYELTQFKKLHNDQKSVIMQSDYCQNMKTKIKSLRDKVSQMKIEYSTLLEKHTQLQIDSKGTEKI